MWLDALSERLYCVALQFENYTLASDALELDIREVFSTISTYYNATDMVNAFFAGIPHGEEIAANIAKYKKIQPSLEAMLDAAIISAIRADDWNEARMVTGYLTRKEVYSFARRHKWDENFPDVMNALATVAIYSGEEMTKAAVDLARKYARDENLLEDVMNALGLTAMFTEDYAIMRRVVEICRYFDAELLDPVLSAISNAAGAYKDNIFQNKAALIKVLDTFDRLKDIPEQLSDAMDGYSRYFSDEINQEARAILAAKFGPSYTPAPLNHFLN